MILELLILACLSTAHADRVRVPGGSFTPIFQDKGEDSIQIPSLLVDSTPVTNEKYLEFVKRLPQWQKSKIPSIFADTAYLKHWIDDLAFSSQIAKYPVVNVSWPAAKAYCKWADGRLPSTFEWEYFSDAGNSKQESETLKWYAKGQELHQVGLGSANRFGLKDTSGLVWEWVIDFQSAIMSSDSREGTKRDMFCGGASLNSKDPKQYAAFMRYALRASLKANYTTSSLGFRCVQDINQEKK